MKKFLLSLTLILAFAFSGFCQLPSGSPAPAFTVTDLDGNTHDLYTYLNNGVSVVIDVSATWCGPCWSYHNSGTLENFYTSYGPSGTGEVMVIFAEGDPSTNINCLYGPSGCVGGTQGDWVNGTPYPITHSGGPTIANLYQINAYPTIFMISAGNQKSYTTGGGGVSSTVLGNYVLQSFKLAASATVTDAVCGNDGQISLDVTYGYGNKTYAWSNGSTTKDLNNLNPGAYICTITDANNYQIVTDAFIVGGNSVPVSAFNTLSQEPSCFGGNNGSVGVLGTAGNGGYTYLWDDGQSTPTKMNIGAGDHYVTVSDVLGCAFETFVVLGEPTPVSATAQAPNIPCGQTTGTATLSATGGNGPYLFDIGSGSQSSGIFSNLSPGTYNYSVADNGGCDVQGQFTITAITGPAAVASSAGNITCTVTQTTVSAVGSASGNGISYTWSTANGNIVSGQNQSEAIVSAGGTYVLSVLDAATGCSSTTSTIVTADASVPQVSIAAPATITCTNPETVLQGTVNGDVNDYTISWSTSNGNIVSGANTLTPTVNADGDYTMQATKNSNACMAISSVAVTENINTANGAYQYTLDGNTFNGQATASGSTTTYAWDFGNGTTSTVANPTVALNVGTFNICLTVTTECGSNMVCQQVTYSSVLSAAPTAANITCNGANNGSASANVSGGVAPLTYAWSGPNNFTSTNADISGLAAGVYTLVVTDGANASVTQSVTVTEPGALKALSVSIVNDSNSQNVGYINLVAEGGTGTITYLWSNGATTQNLSGIGAGSYTCVITDANGCSKTFGPFTVENSSATDETKYVHGFNVYPNPATSLINVDINFVKSSNVTFSLVNSLGSNVLTRQYQGNINDRVDVSTLSAGVYFVVVKGENFNISRRVVVIK